MTLPDRPGRGDGSCRDPDPRAVPAATPGGRHGDRSSGRNRRFDVDTGREATFFEYRATVAFGGSSVSIRGTTVEIPGGEIGVVGYLSIRHNGRNVLIAAGAHPNESYADAVTDTDYSHCSVVIVIPVGGDHG